MRESELGLSLGLHTKNNDLDQEDNHRELLQEERREKKKEDSIMSNFYSIQNKPQRPELQAMAPPQNRKARVSVRARCESATVSFLFFSFSFFSNLFHVIFLSSGSRVLFAILLTIL